MPAAPDDPHTLEESLEGQAVTGVVDQADVDAAQPPAEVQPPPSPKRRKQCECCGALLRSYADAKWKVCSGCEHHDTPEKRAQCELRKAKLLANKGSSIF